MAATPLEQHLSMFSVPVRHYSTYDCGSQEKKFSSKLKSATVADLGIAFKFLFGVCTTIMGEIRSPS
ncbi:hypothetical protein [Pantanalinema sp. GBBB05]|uniref:hypothetical protein n=1 Tax=Pantanalinema sp. GBBB05 TaxID=2604139 RepID=UPI001E190F14|nr:hypothetical protein [Pantanalinema sp. GBBB05]